jgi:hypothetical protein
MVNLELKAAVVLRYGSQVKGAKELGLGESRLSRLIQGHDTPRPDEARMLHKKLGVKLQAENQVS